MLIPKTAPQQGFSLVELMIAMTLGLILISALVSFVAISVSSHAKLVVQQRLSEELHTLSHLIVNELRRAEYDYNAESMLLPLDGQGSEFVNTMTISQYPDELTNSCIVYAYDKNRDGQLNTSTGNENFGFRLKDHAIEMRQKGASCDANGWQDISDTGVIRIEKLEFTIERASEARRYISLTLSASAKGFSDVQRSLTRTLLKPTRTQ